MPSFLENLIVFALILNIVAFALYGLSLRSKRIKANKIMQEVQINEGKPAENQTEEPTEIRNTIDDDKLDQLVEELKQIENEPETEEFEIEFEEEKKEELTEKSFEVEFVEEIKAEIKEVDKIIEELDTSNEPFELIEGMNEESKFEETKEEKVEVTYSIGNEPKEQEKVEVKGERLEPKREIMDSVNILSVEGEEDSEDIDDEIVVRHYEPLVYQHNMEEEEVVEEEKEEEKEDEDEIEKRIAYLTGEWTEDYVIQPKKGKENRK